MSNRDQLRKEIAIALIHTWQQWNPCFTIEDMAMYLSVELPTTKSEINHMRSQYMAVALDVQTSAIINQMGFHA
jgi:hypothetical protein